MRFRQHPSNLPKTLSFALIHLILAVTIGWLLTDTFVFGALLALAEPVCNTLVGHQLERAFEHRPRSRRRQLLKSGALGLSHLVVAIAVGWALTGSFVAASLYALVEPAANAVAHYFFERWWDRRAEGAAAAGGAAIASMHTT